MQRLGRRAQGGDERRVARGHDDVAAADRDRVHVVEALDELAAPHGYPERLSHGGDSREWAATLQ